MGDPHDEIDVELVGRDSGKVHVNSFRYGKGTAKDIDLGFDASEGVHLCAFEWLPSSITRFVNGVQVRRIAAPDAEIPTATRRVMASVRVANRTSVDWVGEAEFVPTSAINPASV
jgi:beta-glucanase (GH16 family)